MPDHSKMTEMLSLVGKDEWSGRASRCILQWSSTDPVQASSSIAVWASNIAGLSTEQRRIVFRVVAEVAELFEPPVVKYLFYEIIPMALQRVDPYSHSSVSAAQQAAASLLADSPVTALRWAEIPLSGLPSRTRRLILISAFLSRRKLTVFEHFGQLSHLLGSDYSTIRSALRQIDDKYLAGGPVRVLPLSKRSEYQLWFPFSIIIGISLFLLILVVSVQVPYQLRGTTPSGWDGVLLPLFAVVTAVHLLAIDLAASRYPRQVVITTASSPIVLVTYGFFLGEILYAQVGSSTYSVPPHRETNLAFLTVFGIAILLALLVRELIRFQDPRRVANMLWNRAFRQARRAAHLHSDAGDVIQHWEEKKRDLRNVREVSLPPVSRRAHLVLAEKPGILKMDWEKLEALDSEIERLNDMSTSGRIRQTEVVAVTKPGSVVAKGDVIAGVVSDESSISGNLMKELRKSLSVSGGNQLTMTSETTSALFQMISSALKDHDSTTAGSIYSDILSLMRTQLATDRASRNRTFVSAFKSEVDIVLSLERLFRGSLQEHDEFEIDTVRKMMISLCESATQVGAASVIQSLIFRLEFVAREFQGLGLITSVVSAWCDVARFAFVVKDRNMARYAVNSIASMCSKLSNSEDRARDASFCIDRYAELITSGMYADYWAVDIVIDGAQRLKDMIVGECTSLARYWAMMNLLGLGAASLESGRYSLALDIVRLMRTAHMNFDAAVESLRRKDTAANIQAKSTLAGEVMGADVEAAVIRYQLWVHSLPEGLITLG